MTTENHPHRISELDGLLDHAERLQSQIMKWRVVLRVLVVGAVVVVLLLLEQLILIDHKLSLIEYYDRREVPELSSPAGRALLLAAAYTIALSLLLFYMLVKAFSLSRYLRRTKKV